jgi:hypothetical protein
LLSDQTTAGVSSPLTDSNRRPPPYHALRLATGRNPRQRFSLVSAVFGLFGFATGCQRLPPRGSIRAPCFVVIRGNRVVADLLGWTPSLFERWSSSRARRLLEAVAPTDHRHELVPLRGVMRLMLPGRAGPKRTCGVTGVSKAFPDRARHASLVSWEPSRRGRKVERRLGLTAYGAGSKWAKPVWKV